MQTQASHKWSHTEAERRKNPLKVKLNLSLFMDFFEWFLTGKRTPPASIIGGERHPLLLLLFWAVAELMWDEKVRWNGNTTIFESIDFCLVWGPINKTQWGAIYRRVVATYSSIHNRNRKKRYATTFRRKSLLSELLIFHFGTSWCLHPLSPCCLTEENFGGTIRGTKSTHLTYQMKLLYVCTQ